MSRFSTYNKIFLIYKYPMYIHYNEKNEFIPMNVSNIHYNVSDYVTVQFLYNSHSNVRYFYHHIYNSCLVHKQHDREYKIYQQIQRFKLTFSRFVHMVQLKYKKRFNEETLSFQSFSTQPLQIYENQFVYSFDELELFKMIESCFNYEQYDIPVVLTLKNPYTNIPFKKHHLIYFYFELLKRGKNSLFFTIYFKHNFKKSTVVEHYEIHLYIHCLKRKCSELNDQMKMNVLLHMFRVFSKYKTFRNINENLIQQLFGCVLEPFYIYRNLRRVSADDDSNLLELYKKQITSRLEYVYERNPSLGRKMFYKNILGNYSTYINETVFNID